MLVLYYRPGCDIGFNFYILTHLYLAMAKRPCFFSNVVIIKSTLLNFFLMANSSNLNPVSYFILILSNLVSFFVKTSPPQYFNALSLNYYLF